MFSLFVLIFVTGCCRWISSGWFTMNGGRCGDCVFCKRLTDQRFWQCRQRWRHIAWGIGVWFIGNKVHRVTAKYFYKAERQMWSVYNQLCSLVFISVGWQQYSSLLDNQNDTNLNQFWFKSISIRCVEPLVVDVAGIF